MAYAIKYKKVAGIGHRVSHAKNRTKHAFKRNLQTATIVVDGKKQKVLVPAKVLKTLKKEGLVPDYKAMAKEKRGEKGKEKVAKTEGKKETK